MSQPGRAVRPDARCPCGSGRKHRNCCGRKPVAAPPVESRVDWLAPAEQSLRKEIDYIVGRARTREAHVVGFGQLQLFSTVTGDAWLLDVEDRTALPLARDGDRLDARILETEAQFVIEWTHDYEVDGEVFVVREKRTGQVRSIVGYGASLLGQVR